MTDEPRPVRPFTEWLADQASGAADVQATQALQQVVQAVGDLGRKGKVVIEVLVEPANQSASMMKTAVTVTAKPPAPFADESVFYADPNGSLVRDDPFQARLPLREIDPDTAEIRDLGNPEGDNE